MIYFFVGILLFFTPFLEAKENALVGTSAKNSSITKRFLTKSSIEEIEQYLLENDRLDMAPFKELFKEAIEKETGGFFGYHATTMKHWVFNEIIKQVLTLKGYPPIRDDMYFLRAPQEYDEDIVDVKTFLSKCLQGRNRASIIEKKEFISTGFLKILGKKDLFYTKEQIDKVFKALLAFSPFPSDLSKEEAKLCLLDFVGEEAYQLWLSRRFDYDFYRVFLESLDIDVLLRYSALYSPIADTIPWQQKLLVSVNIPLFANFTIPTESTIHVFMKGQSIDETAGEILEEETEKFLQIHGFPKELGKEIFEEAQKITNLQKGILLQFFDDSEYSHLDQLSFICMGFNSFSLEKRVSSYIAQFDPDTNIGQIRLLITKELLDPTTSWLIVKQYDLSEPKKKEEVKRVIRQKLNRA